MPFESRRRKRRRSADIAVHINKPFRVAVQELVTDKTGETKAPKIDATKEHTFLLEASSSTQLSSRLWYPYIPSHTYIHLIRRSFRLDWLSDISAAPSIDSEHFTWRLKVAIGFLHVSDEPFLGQLRVKSSAILELRTILEEKDMSSKQRQLTDFIEKYKTVMAAAAGASDSEKNSNLTAKATSTDTDFNSSSENAMLAQDATSSKSPGLFSNEPQLPKSGIASSLMFPCLSPPPTEIVDVLEERCRRTVGFSQVCPHLLSECPVDASPLQQSPPLDLCTPFLLFPAMALSTETPSPSLIFGEAKNTRHDHAKNVLPIGQNPTVTFNRLNLPIGRMSSPPSINESAISKVNGRLC